MKILNKKEVEKRNQKIHTKAERSILENMNSSFIIQLNYAFQTADKLYLVMEFMIGGNIYQYYYCNFHEKGSCFFILEKLKDLPKLAPNFILPN